MALFSPDHHGDHSSYQTPCHYLLRESYLRLDACWLDSHGYLGAEGAAVATAGSGCVVAG